MSELSADIVWTNYAIVDKKRGNILFFVHNMVETGDFVYASLIYLCCLGCNFLSILKPARSSFTTVFVR